MGGGGGGYFAELSRKILPSQYTSLSFPKPFFWGGRGSEERDPILCLTVVLRSIFPNFFVNLSTFQLSFLTFTWCNSNIYIFSSYPNPCFTDWDYRLPDDWGVLYPHTLL